MSTTYATRRAERWADLARIASICRHPRAELYAQIARDVAALARGES